MNFAIINASKPPHQELDVYTDYRQGYNSYFDGDKILKRCTSWHSLPAVCETEFFVYNKPGWQGIFKYKNVLVLIERDIENVEPLMQKLKSAKKIVAVAYHEGVQDFLTNSMDFNWLLSFKKVCNQADFYWNLFSTYNDFYENLLEMPVFDCLHAWPYDIWKHNFNVDFEKKEGILIGTRTFSQRLLRNTLLSLAIVGRSYPVTLLCEDSLPVNKILNELGFSSVECIKGPLRYEDWLKLIAKHKFVYHNDFSMNFGQIVGDCALVDTLCVGGITECNKVLDTGFMGYFNEDISMMNDLFNNEKDYNFLIKQFKKETNFKKIRSKTKVAFS